MAQRVGIARALTVQPEILLLNEPLGALDAMTKITMILVTHDIEKPIYVTNRVLVLPKQRGVDSRLFDVPISQSRDCIKAAFVAIRSL